MLNGLTGLVPKNLVKLSYTEAVAIDDYPPKTEKGKLSVNKGQIINITEEPENYFEGFLIDGKSGKVSQHYCKVSFAKAKATMGYKATFDIDLSFPKDAIIDITSANTEDSEDPPKGYMGFLSNGKYGHAPQNFINIISIGGHDL